MGINIKNARAYELVKFLTVAPKDVADVKTFAKLQRMKAAVEKGIEDYAKVINSFLVWRSEQLKSYQVQYQEVSKDKTDDEKKELRKEIDEAFNLNISERGDEAQKYEAEEGVKVQSITVNPEDLNFVRDFFGKKGHEFPFWEQTPASYSEMIESLGVVID